MNKIILTLFALLIGSFEVGAQNSAGAIKQIRKLYAEAKKELADNGKNGKAPLDICVKMRDATKLDEDEVIDDLTELNFYFNKYRVNSELGYPDASSCYFIIENWSANGHTRYREMLFDPNEGYLLFSYMRGETHAGFVVESRYYYGADGSLIDQKHKVGGKEATANSHTWSSADGDKVLSAKYLELFDDLMNSKKEVAEQTSNMSKVEAADPSRMKFIRGIYAEAKEKIAKNDKSDFSHDLQIVIRDQSWGPPETTEMKFYFDDVNDGVGSGGATMDKRCYFISNHHHNNNMGFDNYSEFLFAPKSNDLIFSYTSAKEEGVKNEWRYYFDKNGKCIEVKTGAEEWDNGSADKKTVVHLLEILKKLFDAIM